MSGDQPPTRGETVAEARAGPFRLTERVYPAHYRLGRHAHQRPSLMIVVRGSVEECVSNRCYTCSPWSVLAKPAAEPHEDVFGARGARCLSIELMDSDGRELSSPPLDRVVFSPTGRFAGLLQLIYHELRFPDAFSALALEGWILELLVSFGRETVLGTEAVEGPHWLGRARELMRERFSETLRLSDLASELGVHPAHLARVFRQAFGLSPSTYLRRLRISWAQQQLARTARPLADIALAAGFADQSHLTRSFAREVGVTPSRYRKLCRTTGDVSRVQKSALDRF